MLTVLFLVLSVCKNISAQLTTEEIQYLNELPMDKLLQLKESLKDFVPQYDNETLQTTSYLDNFGAQAMAIQAPPLKRLDFEEHKIKKVEHGKISHIFSLSVTTLAFLAFGGYLLCLIVHALKAKQDSYTVSSTQATFFLSSGVKRPQQQFASYGRMKRDNGDFNGLDLPPEQLFSALLQLCEGYAKWRKQHNS